MNIAFYIDEMNFRGVTNSTFQYSIHNEKILNNKSIIFYNKSNSRNQIEVIKKFKKKFTVLSVKNFAEIENYKKKFNLSFIYCQKGGEKDKWISHKVKTIAHSLYPQRLTQIHGHKYIFVSDWLSKKFSNNKISFLPYIVELNKTKKNFKKKYKINNKNIVIGCHGGESSFDLEFAKDTVIEIANKRKNIIFLFLNIKKFCNHPRIFFLPGSFDEIFKKKFLNTCDAMLYGRSLGESFGLACGEFAILSKPIISYKFNRHRAHIDQLSSKSYVEYSSKKKLFKILYNFKKININSKNRNKYFNYSPKKVMKIFKNILVQKIKPIKFSGKDYLINYLNFFIMNYFYIRHKFYNHYYNFIEKKL